MACSFKSSVTWVELLSEQISYIEYSAIIDGTFTLEIRRLSIVTSARIPNIFGLVYSMYQHETSVRSSGLN